jgi:hypothetical protein
LSPSRFTFSAAAIFWRPCDSVGGPLGTTGVELDEPSARWGNGRSFSNDEVSGDGSLFVLSLLAGGGDDDCKNCEKLDLGIVDDVTGG